MIPFIAIVIVVALFLVTYSFVVHRIEEKRTNDLNNSLRRNRKKVNRMPVAKPSVQYPEIPVDDVFTWRGYVDSTSGVKNPKLGDIVFCNGKTLLFNDKKEWEIIEGLI